MKHTYLLSLLVLSTLILSACGSLTVAAPNDPSFPVATEAVTPPSMEPTTTPEVFIALTQAIPGELQPTDAVLATTFNGITLNIPQGVADGASGDIYPRVDSPDAAWWQKTPGHRQINLGDYYALKGKTYQPAIYVYPATAYAELVPAAFESIHRLNNYLYDPTAPTTKDQLPAVPFLNAAPMIASQVQPVNFQNGSGMRMVSWYSQGLAPVTNQELFYHFEGTTSDGQYYIVAVLPVTAAILQEIPGSVVPAGGVTMPDLNSANPDMPGYYASIQQALDSLSSVDFTPSLDQLDAMMRSLLVTP